MEGGDQEHRAECKEKEQGLSAACSFSKRLRGIQNWVNDSWIVKRAIQLPILSLAFCCLWCLLEPTVSWTNSLVQQKTRPSGCFSAKFVHCVSSAESPKPRQWTVGEMLCVRKEGERSEMGRGSKKASFWQIDSAVWYNLTSNMWLHTIPNAVNYRKSLSHMLRYGVTSSTAAWPLMVHISSLHTQKLFPLLISSSSVRSQRELREQRCVAEEEGRSLH